MGHITILLNLTELFGTMARVVNRECVHTLLACLEGWGTGGWI